MLRSPSQRNIGNPLAAAATPAAEVKSSNAPLIVRAPTLVQNINDQIKQLNTELLALINPKSLVSSAVQLAVTTSYQQLAKACADVTQEAILNDLDKPLSSGDFEIRIDLIRSKKASLLAEASKLLPAEKNLPIAIEHTFELYIALLFQRFNLFKCEPSFQQKLKTQAEKNTQLVSHEDEVTKKLSEMTQLLDEYKTAISSFSVDEEKLQGDFAAAFEAEEKEMLNSFNTRMGAHNRTKEAIKTELRPEIQLDKERNQLLEKLGVRLITANLGDLKIIENDLKDKIKTAPTTIASPDFKAAIDATSQSINSIENYTLPEFNPVKNLITSSFQDIRARIRKAHAALKELVEKIYHSANESKLSTEYQAQYIQLLEAQRKHLSLFLDERYKDVPSAAYWDQFKKAIAKLNQFVFSQLLLLEGQTAKNQLALDKIHAKKEIDDYLKIQSLLELFSKLVSELEKCKIEFKIDKASGVITLVNKPFVTISEAFSESQQEIAQRLIDHASNTRNTLKLSFTTRLQASIGDIEAIKRGYTQMLGTRKRIHKRADDLLAQVAERRRQLIARQEPVGIAPDQGNAKTKIRPAISTPPVLRAVPPVNAGDKETQSETPAAASAAQAEADEASPSQRNAGKRDRGHISKPPALPARSAVDVDDATITGDATLTLVRKPARERRALRAQPESQSLAALVPPRPASPTRQTRAQSRDEVAQVEAPQRRSSFAKFAWGFLSVATTAASIVGALVVFGLLLPTNPLVAGAVAIGIIQAGSLVSLGFAKKSEEAGEEPAAEANAQPIDHNVADDTDYQPLPDSDSPTSRKSSRQASVPLQPVGSPVNKIDLGKSKNWSPTRNQPAPDGDSLPPLEAAPTLKQPSMRL